MKKKILVYVLIMALAAAVFSSCGKKKNDTATDTSSTGEQLPAEATTTQDDQSQKEQHAETAEEAPALEKNNSVAESAKDIDAISDINVEKKIFDVTLTIPKDFVGEMTQEELDKTVTEKGYKSATLNEDGSVTYVITKAQHKAMMEDVTKTIDQALSEIPNSEDYPNVTSVTANSDYTSFTITTKNAEPDLGETFGALMLYMYGGMYATFNGDKVENIHVDFVNADSGEVISSGDSKNLGKSN